MSVEPGFGLDISVFDTVIDQGGAEARMALAEKLAGLLADDGASALEKQQVVPVILKLAVDPERQVRETLVHQLTPIENLHGDIVFALIADADDLALPFLRHTPSLDSWHMMAILRVGDEARQKAVAGRSDITAEAAAYILKSAPASVCLTLFDNEVVAFDGGDYQHLYNRFANEPAVVERLLKVPDLPLDIRILQAKRASSRMHMLMAERGWLPANNAAQMLEDAEEGAILRILTEASAEERVGAIAFVASKNMLTPALIVRAATLGEMAVVEGALAHLANMSLTRARDMMYGGGALSLRSLLKKSGLPSSCHVLLRAASDVVAEHQERGLTLTAGDFGRQLIEALMTRYDDLRSAERARQLDYVGRFGEEKVRLIARRLKADMVRAA